MIKFKDLSITVRDEHLNLMKSRFLGSSAKLKISPVSIYPPYIDNLMNYLRGSLDVILTGGPDELLSIVDHVINHYPEFHKQAKRKRKSTEWEAYPRDAAAVQLVESCFNYSKFSEKGTSWGAYRLVQELGFRVCPYCHLHHVNYHMPSGEGDFSLRPPLDHFLPKAFYPYLAVSLGNLVPCCSQCNSSIKLALDPLETGLVHPRIASSVGRVKFSAQSSVPGAAILSSNDITLNVVASSKEAAAHAEAFKLQDRYEWYSHEVLDLINNYGRFLEYSDIVKKAVWKADFVLGFSPDIAGERAMGLCLLDVFEELESGSVV